MNPWFYPTMVAGFGLFFAGRAASAKAAPGTLAEKVVLAAGFLAGLPGLLYGFYYGHLLLDKAVWFYELRSWPGTELLAAGMGFSAGVFNERMLRRPPGKRPVGTLVAVLALATALGMPYLKNIKHPIKKESLADSWANGVCLQSSSSTCGACCAATLLRGAGVQVTEAEVAEGAYTSLGGTEAWYLARFMRSKGVRVRFVSQDPALPELPYPSIAGVRMGGPGGFGHFITVIERTPKGYALGDPLFGRILLPDHRLRAEYEFTGFFLALDLSAEKARSFRVR
ncbi:MAG: cysteine peptidase family C39 domain-containing protein [Elusimicrobiota bacterium]|jgi:hypothetical protein